MDTYFDRLHDRLVRQLTKLLGDDHPYPAWERILESWWEWADRKMLSAG